MNLNEQIQATPFAEHWKKVGARPHHGINLPLSAILTKKSCGIGEFHDLIPLIDWCQKVGFDLIQLLPINDSGDDPSPYFILSSCALNPLYISLRDLPHVMPSALLEELSTLNHSDRVQFHEVQSRKLLFLRRYYEEFGSLIIDGKYEQFLKEEPWVETYALFKVLKEQMTKNHWLTWPAEYQRLTAKTREELLMHNRSEIQFHCLLQFLAAEQMSNVIKYARSKGVLLMGDFPILICTDSCDVWERPEEFDSSLLAGAPPDYYNPDGQVWGFPLFRWDVMRAKSYDWFTLRFRYLSRFFDLIRIDHVLGFFRIWAVPPNRPSTEGQFIPSDPTQWLPHGRTLLKVIGNSSSMLPVAEDLGAIFPGVRPLLSELGICGTRMMRWERNWEEESKLFISPKDYPPLSLTTLSTHDSETLALWWRDRPEEAGPYAAQKNWSYSSLLSYEQRIDILRDSHTSGSLFHVNLIGEYLALFPELVAPRLEDERINIPGKVLPTNWTYRIRPSIEELTAHQPLQAALRSILK